MIEADFAELVDEDQRVRKRGIVQQPVEERGFARAQKARQHREGNGRRRPTAPSYVFRQIGHVSVVGHVSHGFSVPHRAVQGFAVLLLYLRQMLEQVLEPVLQRASTQAVLLALRLRRRLWSQAWYWKAWY